MCVYVCLYVCVCVLVGLADGSVCLRLQVVAQQGAGAVSVRLGALAPRSQAQLQGFKSRALRAVTPRRWLYTLQWSAADNDLSQPLQTDLFELLVVGILPHLGCSENHSTHIVSQDSWSPSGQWHAVAIASSLRQGPLSRMAELRVMDLVLILLQTQAVQRTLWPLWICTTDTQPSSTAPRGANAGLWGLARSCRQELGILPAWCVDVQQGLEGTTSFASVLRSHTLQLCDGSVRGLQTGASVEPEGAYVMRTWRVPRLVAPYSVQPTKPGGTLADLSLRLDAYITKAMSTIDIERLTPAYALLERLCQQYVNIDIQRLTEQQIPAWYHKLLYLWASLQKVPHSDVAITPEDVCAIHPDLWAEVQLAEKCGPWLADALSGNVAYQELLFPGGSMEAVLPVYEHGVCGAFYNSCVVAAVEGILAFLPSENRIVVLEVGAGTGGTASSVLPILKEVCRCYLFTDVSEVFLRQARKRFSDYSFIDYKLLNIDAEPCLQGFASRQCGIIIATNSLHATPFMRNTLRNCRELLAPGGTLVINDAVAISAFAQITFGLTDGWWLFSEVRDPERVGQHSPLLSWRQWESLLSDTGFQHSHCMQGSDFLQVQAVIVAQGSTAPHPGMDVELNNGAHFLSGGLGGLGLLTARLLVEAGAKQLVLSSRSDRVVAGSESEWSWLSNCGSQVCRICCDISNERDILTSLYELHSNALRLGGIFHAAHQLADATLANQAVFNFRATYGPKVQGAATLHATTSCSPLKLFNVYSSAAGLMGSAGQASHSAANACLNTMSEFRRNLGLPGQSVSWGAVSEIGYAARHGADKRADVSGSGAISRAMAIDVLKSTLVPGVRSFAVLPADWPKLLAGCSEVHGYLTPYAHLRAHTRSPAAPKHSLTGGAASMSRLAEITSAPIGSPLGLEAVLQMVRQTAGGEIEADAPLMEAGVDSLGAVELRNQLQRVVGSETSLPSTLVFDHPTARALASIFAYATPPAVFKEKQLASSSRGVDLASLEASLPGGARGLELTYRLVNTGRDAFSSSPATRWESADIIQTGVAHGAFMHDIELFDHTLFSVSPSEASTMDPQQRQLLEIGYSALHTAHLQRSILTESNTAVFVGVMSTEFREALQTSNVYAMTGTGHCFVAGRLSYVFGLHGACEAIDTACSASLVACHHAYRASLSRDCDGALFSGVNMMFLPSTAAGYVAAGFASASGKAFVFDARADGFSRGEGCIAGVFPAVTSDELRQTTGQQIIGSAVRQDGRSASLTAPSGRAQQLLLNAVLADASTLPAQIPLLESAANGSRLGDAIEVGAIASAILKLRGSSEAPLLIGSIKANIGYVYHSLPYCAY